MCGCVVYLLKKFIMVGILVYMSNDSDGQRYKTIEITKEELEQMACDKARGEFGNVFNHIVPVEGTLKVKSVL